MFFVTRQCLQCGLGGGGGVMSQQNQTRLSFITERSKKLVLDLNEETSAVLTNFSFRPWKRRIVLAEFVHVLLCTVF